MPQRKCISRSLTSWRCAGTTSSRESFASVVRESEEPGLVALERRHEARRDVAHAASLDVPEDLRADASQSVPVAISRTTNITPRRKTRSEEVVSVEEAEAACAAAPPRAGNVDEHLDEVDFRELAGLVHGVHEDFAPARFHSGTTSFTGRGGSLSERRMDHFPSGAIIYRDRAEGRARSALRTVANLGAALEAMTEALTTTAATLSKTSTELVDCVPSATTAGARASR